MKLRKWDFKETLLLLTWAKFKIPALYFVGPRIMSLTDTQAQVLIPLNRRTKNHLGSMYFGVLSIGADMAGGIIIFKLLRQRSEKVSLIFKDFQAQFLKRAEGDTLFTCTDGLVLQQLLDQAVTSGKRLEDTVRVIATCPDKLGDTPVAEFRLTISLKRQDH